ncbi:hypothetical protein CHU95_02250 [Niveispirillum lacus]|uniref:PqqD family protein n=1 Tax=Niveispirillum lacus TaxID=1981099 RepID=A0A255Z969_9PROT|nr:PqqD family peptide modification chaperone [Niveispirillum lacus]OYQ37190.1 hypothetical protein CHU95_02250 [Niveispirillum lacus]
MPTLSSHIRARSDLLSTEIDGETVMMDVESGQYFTLDVIGTRIWKALADPVEVAALCRTLETEFDAPLAMIERDVLALLADLQARNLITVER